MRHLLLSASLGACLPLLSIAAEERVPLTVPSPRAPEASGRDQAGMLIDTVIPAYGVHHTRPYRPSSDVEHLYHDIQRFAADLDARVMSNQLARPTAGVDDEGNPIREPIAEEQRLGELLQQLAEERLRVPFPNHYEQWHIENAQRDLERSASLLRLGLGDDTYLRLEHMHAAWRQYHRLLLKQAQHERAQELVDTQGLRPLNALQQAEAEITSIPAPQMSLDGTYEEVIIVEVISERERSRLEREAARAAAAAAAKDEEDAPLDDPITEDEPDIDEIIDEEDADEADDIDRMLDDLLDEEPPEIPAEEPEEEPISETDWIIEDPVEEAPPVIEEPVVEEEPTIEEPVIEEEPEVEEEPAVEEEEDAVDESLIDDLDDIDWDAL